MCQARRVGATSSAELIRIGRKSRDACDNQVIDDSLPSGREPGIDSDGSQFDQPWCQCGCAASDTDGSRRHEFLYPWQAQTNLVVRSKYVYEADELIDTNCVARSLTPTTSDSRSGVLPT